MAADQDPPLSEPWEPALEDLRERVDEAESILRRNRDRPKRDAALRLVGEGLRSWVLLARSLGIDPEQALRQADDAQIDAVQSREAL